MNKTFENCTLLDTKTWFEKARPEPSVADFSAQLGVHYEEVAESLECLASSTILGSRLIHDAHTALEALGTYLKTTHGAIYVDQEQDSNFLDSLCDQIVTATGVAHCSGYDVVGAMTEVNASNFSKFDENGQPIFNEQKKVMKGPNFFKPNLTPYLPK